MLLHCVVVFAFKLLVQHCAISCATLRNKISVVIMRKVYFLLGSFPTGSLVKVYFF